MPRPDRALRPVSARSLGGGLPERGTVVAGDLAPGLRRWPHQREGLRAELAHRAPPAKQRTTPGTRPPVRATRNLLAVAPPRSVPDGRPAGICHVSLSHVSTDCCGGSARRGVQRGV